MTRADAQDLRIVPERAALVMVDVQERLWAVMAEEHRAGCLRNLEILVELARRLRIPVVQSEQYPQGLGRTISPLATALAAPDVRLMRLEKVEFACTDAPGWGAIAGELRRDQWIVAGMEAHVCVYQTVRGLAASGHMVHVPADAVISRTRDNRQIGLDLCARVGGVVTATEVVVFDALHRAATDDFRAMSRLVK
jgi:nicotinamidase-related amidase